MAVSSARTVPFRPSPALSFSERRAGADGAWRRVRKIFRGLRLISSTPQKTKTKEWPNDELGLVGRYV
jgi:hypothetical protein